MNEISLMTADEQKRLFELQDAKMRALRALTAKAEMVKEAKHAYTAACGNVDAYIAEFKASNMPLFNGPKQQQTYEAGESQILTADTEDLWKFVRIEELLFHGCKTGDVAKLKDAGIHTLGAIVEYTADGNRRLGDIKRVGEKTADRITDALIHYHQANTQRPEMPQDEPEDEDDESTDQGTEDASENSPDGLDFVCGSDNSE